MDKDYYAILGICESASADDIKQAYRKLARKWHPDIAGSTPNVLKTFKNINEAYEILSDNTRKAEYDRARSFYKYAQNGSNRTNKQEERKTNTFETNMATYPGFKEFSFNWNEFIHRKETKKQENPVPVRGEDIYTDVELTVMEAINGTEKIINMLQTSSCPKCCGRKFVNGTKCTHCNGKGEVSNYKKFTVKIPAGIKNGSKIRLAKEGGIGTNGGCNGDLYITVHIQELNDCKTEGLNIIKRVFIAPYEAVLGANIEINTINGNYNIKIAPNTQNGQKIRLSGCGIVQNGKIGDMIVVLEIKIPKTLSKEEIDLYKKLAEVSSQIIRD